jgi:tripartite-type tricarboxylate transporter receptor subunit TctC
MAEGKTALAAQGMEVTPSSPEEMGTLMKKDAARWGAVVKQAGIKAE